MEHYSAVREFVEYSVVRAYCACTPRRRSIKGCANHGHVRAARRAHRAGVLHGRRRGRCQQPCTERTGPTISRPRRRRGKSVARTSSPSRVGCRGKSNWFPSRRNVGLPRFGHGRQPNQQQPRLFSHGRHRRSGWQVGCSHSPRTPAGVSHVQRRSTRLSAPRSLEGARHQRARIRPRRRRRVVSRSRRAMAASEDVLLHVVAHAINRNSRSAVAPAWQVAVRRNVVRSPRLRQPDHHPHSCRPIYVCPFGCASRAQNASRRKRAVLVWSQR